MQEVRGGRAGWEFTHVLSTYLVPATTAGGNAGSVSVSALPAYRFEKLADGVCKLWRGGGAEGKTSCSWTCINVYQTRCCSCSQHPSLLTSLSPARPLPMGNPCSGISNTPLAFALLFYFFSRLCTCSSPSLPCSPASFRSALHFQGFVSFICINFHFPLTLTALSTLPRHAPFLLTPTICRLPSFPSFLSTKPSVNFMQFQSIRFAWIFHSFSLAFA